MALSWRCSCMPPLVPASAATSYAHVGLFELEKVRGGNFRLSLCPCVHVVNDPLDVFWVGAHFLQPPYSSSSYNLLALDVTPWRLCLQGPSLSCRALPRNLSVGGWRYSRVVALSPRVSCNLVTRLSLCYTSVVDRGSLPNEKFARWTVVGVERAWL